MWNVWEQSRYGRLGFVRPGYLKQSAATAFTVICGGSHGNSAVITSRRTPDLDNFSVGNCDHNRREFDAGAVKRSYDRGTCSVAFDNYYGTTRPSRDRLVTEIIGQSDRRVNLKSRRRRLGPA